MKRKRKILTGLAFTLLFLISMSFCALAGNEEKIHIIYGLDEEGNAVIAQTAVVLDLGEGYCVMTSVNILNKDSERFDLVDGITGQNYNVVPVNLFEDYGIVVFDFSDSILPEERIMSLAQASKDQIVTMVYMDLERYVHEARVQMTDAEEGAQEIITELYITALDDITETFVLPAPLIDDQGRMVGLYSNDGKIVGFGMDVNMFYANSSSAGSSTSASEEETARSTEETSSPGRPDPAEPESDDSISIGLILGCVAAVIVVVILIAGLAGGKKKDPIVISSGSPEPKPEPVPRQDPAPSPAPVTDPVRPGPAPQPAAITVEIVATAGIMQGRTYTIGAEGISIGRDVSCGIRFPKETNGVSRNHCRISWNSQGALTIMDCGSSYGTYLSGYGKLPERHPVAVKSGDTFCVGSEKNAFKIQIKM
mgnify:CR=1 FL=1